MLCSVLFSEARLNRLPLENPREDALVRAHFPHTHTTHNIVPNIQTNNLSLSLSLFRCSILETCLVA